MTPAATRLDKLFRFTTLQQQALTKLGISTTHDLLYYFPNRYEQPGNIKPIAELVLGETITTYGKISKIKISKAFHKKIPMSEAVIEDETGKIKAVWFHQAYMAKKVPEGAWAKLRGKVTERKGELYLANPEIEAVPEGAPRSHNLFVSKDGDEPVSLIPVYPEVRALSSGWFYYHIQTILKQGAADSVIDPIPAPILKKYNLPKLGSALVWIHSPRSGRDAEAARKRFAFEEILLIQLARQRDRLSYQAHGAYKVGATSSELTEFTKRFPFQPTAGQHSAINTIVNDLKQEKPMARLLEGDVGSGKTVVAAASTFAVVKAGFEVAYMVPTEILAKQHFESFIQYFAHLGIQIGLITGSECRKFPSKINPHEHTHISRAQLLKWVANGDIPIVIGTHSLIQKSVAFRNLAYVIIDEQHRFGVMQRAGLVGKSAGSKATPHLLSMTATPIPRTLALTIYGDLDLSILDEMPHGRKPIITEIVTEATRAKAYKKIRTELQAGRQAYIICPRINEPDPTKELALQAKSAKAERDRLAKTVFSEYEVGLLHSKMTPKDKEEVMRQFTNNEIQILVATSVVEVGVNVPNATLIMIEGAERFGLAQLHQLRGRVIRSNHQAYCFAVSESTNKPTLERLKALTTAKNGFELAELDLALRGSGSLTGTKQWGLSDLGMEAIKNIKMVEAARTEAHALLREDADLRGHPLLLAKLDNEKRAIHFE